ncbi:MAG: tRNA dihydrouridine(20/20a) synthase DusA [Alphaproteobacteria bacterium PRO2]|nr:tRNA dihydrouridine(20/20a) synthase DusA [Alphaproteobacteria bacterium PRO2]
MQDSKSPLASTSSTISMPEISVAPMMDWTDRHCRYFHRLLSPSVKLYTEMVTTGAILHGDKDRFLRFDQTQHPIALQLGGSDAADLAFGAEAGENAGYDEINLNCGCPSDRVQSGRFGACLMREPSHVAECVEAMVKAVDIPVTVKCRIGIDDEDSFEFLDKFVGEIADRGCKTFVIHARKAWLKGLSPKENREVPPLDYERVRKIKEKYPHLRIILNGGLTTIEQIKEAISPSLSSRRKPGSGNLMPQTQPDSGLRRNDNFLDGAMIGREAYQNPWFLTQIEKEIFRRNPSPRSALPRLPLPEGEGDPSDKRGSGEGLSRETIVLKMHSYAREQRKLYDTRVKNFICVNLYL